MFWGISRFYDKELTCDGMFGVSIFWDTDWGESNIDYFGLEGSGFD